MTTLSNLPIIGLSGTFASGKDTLAHHLINAHDFYHVSTGDLVRAVAMELHGNTERPTLVSTANQLRAERGSGVLVELALEAFKDKQNLYKGLVISGIRSLGEAEALKNSGGQLIFIDAPVEKRYQWAMARMRANEHKLTFKEFQASEEAEMHSARSSDTAQNIAAVKELANINIQNTGTIEEFVASASQQLGLESGS